jgi:hypothetical protein
MITSLELSPEPPTWAMMLLGFAGLGYMIYRRRGAPSALKPLIDRLATIVDVGGPCLGAVG